MFLSLSKGCGVGRCSVVSAVPGVPAGLFCSAHEQCPHGGMAARAGAGSSAIACSGGSPVRELQTQPQHVEQFPFMSGLCFGYRNKLWVWVERFKGIVGILVLVLASPRGSGWEGPLPLESFLFIFNQMSTSSISHLVSDSIPCVGSICPKREGAPSWVWTVQVCSGSLGSSLARASGAVQPARTVSGRILALWQICILFHPT